MGHLKLQPLSRVDRALLDDRVEDQSELAVAQAARTTRLAIARARLGLRLKTPTREKICAFLHGR